MREKHLRTSDRVYETLLQEIQSGALAAETVLGEVEQAERLGVSRTPMREALRRLITDGLVLQQSPRVLIVSGINAANIGSLFEARRAFEEAAARIAAERGDREEFDSLATAFDTARLDSANDVDAYYTLIARFDAAIDAAVDNAYLTAALRTVRTHLARARRLARDNDARLQASVAEHALIASAISRRDGELAAHATHVHLHNALAAILTSLREGTQ